MKTIFITILALLFACIICKSQVNMSNYQVRESGGNQALVNSKTTVLTDSTPDFASRDLDTIYNFLKYDDWWSSLIISEIASDECAGGAGTTDGGYYQKIDRGLAQPDLHPNVNPWDYYYKGIERANNYLQYEGRIDWTGNETIRLQYQAEAKFLRAYMHFYLARLFGEIPALDHTLAPDEVLHNTPAKELYSFIISDLKFCAENGLSASYPGIEANWGRATKWAAEAMIGRVYLFYSGYYNDNALNGLTESDAKTYIDDVIQNGGFDLVPEFASLWRVPSYSELGNDTSIAGYAGEINPEVIWSIRYKDSTNYGEVGGNLFARMIGPRNTNINPYGQGWGAMTVLPTLWNAYDSMDKRRTATILSWSHEGLTYNYLVNVQAQYTGYNSKKYEIACVKGSPEPVNWQMGFEDFIVIRFADVLLMGAELHLLSSDTSTALTYINKVRTRAFGDTTHNYTTLTLDSIFNERKLELACEGIRYWDILRSCKGDSTKLTSILTYTDAADGGDFSQTTDVYSKDVDGNNFVPTYGLFQRPYIITGLKGIEEGKNISLQWFVFPNPVNDFLTLTINNFELTSLHFELYDINGRQMENKQVSAKETILDMSRYVRATYILKVVKMKNSLSQEVKTFKIIKN